MGKANFRVAGVIAVLLVLANFVVAWVWDLPVRDPDGVAVPTYIRLPVIVLIAFLLDVLPWTAIEARRRPEGFLRALRPALGHVLHTRWRRQHVVFMLGGLGAWYACYATFRNLKSYVPFVNHHLWDDTLGRIDRALFLGHDPANVLHSLLGTDLAAHFFSFVYIFWIVLIPVTLAIALVFTRSAVRGSWYVTAIAFDWVLGVATYYLVPTLGPIYSQSENFTGLAHTHVTDLERDLLVDRKAVIADVWGAHAVQTIAAFPSLHVGMCITLALFAEWAGLRRAWRVTAWVFLALTVLSTIYLGWHFFVDSLGGAVVGALAAWAAALATGNHVGLRPRLADPAPQETLIASESAPA